jgi:O-methyltransferase
MTAIGRRAQLRDSTVDRVSQIAIPLRERRHLSRVSRRVMDERLTYLEAPNLRTLERCARSVRCDRVPGDFVETGVALGGSGVMLASRMGAGREFHGFDVFGMIPPPSDQDPPEVHERYRTIAEGRSPGIGGDIYYGYVSDLYDRVVETFARYGQPVDGHRVHLHPGLFEDTLHPERPIALAHIDCDWFDPVKLCLERIWPLVSPGGLVILDDYAFYGGCTAAVDAFLADRSDATMVQRTPTGVIRKGTDVRSGANASRAHLDAFARRAAASVSSGGLVLDAGAGRGPYRAHFAHTQYEAADFEQVPGKGYDGNHYVCDLAAIPVERDRYDLILLSQVLEHLPDPATVLNELHRVLKPGGEIWASAPLFYEEHEQPFDFYRYTQFGLRHLFEQAGFTDMRIEWLEGYLATVSYELAVGARVLSGRRWSLPRSALRGLSVLAARADLRFRVTTVGHPKNYTVIARG